MFDYLNFNPNTKLFILTSYDNFQLAGDEKAYEAIDGIALHWYSDFFITDSVMDDLHNKYPDKLILYTETSINGEYGELTNCIIYILQSDSSCHNIFPFVKCTGIYW